MGINVTVVLSLGIVTAITMGLLSGFKILDLFGFMGRNRLGGQSGDNPRCLPPECSGLIKAAGRHQLHPVAAHRPHQRTARRAGFDSHAREPREHVYGQQHRSHHNSGLAVEVDIATIRHRPAAKRIAARHMLMHRAEPYTLRAQTLLATALAGISPVAPWPYMYYSWMLIGMVVLSILFKFPRHLNKRP